MGNLSLLRRLKESFYIKSSPSLVKGISSRFSLQWRYFKKTLAVQEKHLEQWITPLTKGDFSGKKVLDAGCGMGRNAHFYSMWGASNVTAFDLDDEIVKAARNNLKGRQNCAVMKSSIYDIPFENEFDITCCTGVIHHLEHPKDAIKQLIKATKPGGKILIWVYAYEGNERLLTLLIPLRKVMKRCPPNIVATFALLPALLLRIYLRFFPTRNLYYKLIKNYPFQLLHITIVHDQFVPYISRYYTRAELKGLIESSCNHKYTIKFVNNMSYSVLIEKPHREDNK